MVVLARSSLPHGASPGTDEDVEQLEELAATTSPNPLEDRRAWLER